LLRFIAKIDTVNRSVGRVVAFLAPGFMLILAFEVIMRRVFNSPTSWVHETSQYMFGAYFVLGGAYALVEKAHVNVDMILNRLSPRLRSLTDILTSVFFFGFCGVLVWYGGQVAWKALLIQEKSMTYLALPIYPNRIIIFIAGVLLLLQGIAKLVRDIRTVLTGDLK